MLGKHPEMSEAMKMNHFIASGRQKTLLKVRIINAPGRRKQEHVFVAFRRTVFEPESQITATKTEVPISHV